jgi:hypothetical protein
VPVARDHRQRDLLALLELLGGAAGRDHYGLAGRPEVCHVESPRQEALERAEHLRRRRGRGERAERGHAGAPGVEAHGVSPDHGLVHATVPSLEDPAEPIDQEVVGDVAEVPALHVIRVDAADQVVGPAGSVGVAVDGVVHVRHLEAVLGVVGPAPAELLLRPPSRSGDDARLHGRRARAPDRERLRDHPPRSGQDIAGPFEQGGWRCGAGRIHEDDPDVADRVALGESQAQPHAPSLAGPHGRRPLEPGIVGGPRVRGLGGLALDLDG